MTMTGTPMKDSNNTIVIYHADCSDGYAAGYAAWVQFGDEAEYLPYSYDMAPPEAMDSIVYILDFSFPVSVLACLCDRAKEVTIIDHHVGVMPELLQFNRKNFKYIYNVEKSGCVLAWEYFHLSKVPQLLLHIQDRDLWNFDLPDTEAICFGVSAVTFGTFGEWHKMVIDEGVCTHLLSIGTLLLSVHNKQVGRLAERSYPIELVLGGYTWKGTACNANGNYSSTLGNVLAKANDSFGLTYYYDGSKGQWIYSLRSIEGVDILPIAKHYGGGGHTNSAGFILNVLLEELQ